jgi:nucleoside-diphosphate-sugar epimerase
MKPSSNRVLVTGGSGFIGTNLITELLSAQTPVTNLDVAAPRKPEHRGLWQKIDVRDTRLITRAINQFAPTHIVHLAARTDLAGKSLASYSPNTHGVESLIEAISTTRSVTRVLYASSMFVCRPGYQPQNDRDYSPHTLYGESKARGEELVRAADPDHAEWSILRPCSIWGPWFDEPYKKFFEMVLSGWFVKFKGNEARKTYGFVGNVAYHCMKLLEAPRAQVHERTFYLGDRPALTAAEWANLIAKEGGVKPPREVPLIVARAAARVGDLASALGLPSPLTTFRLSNMTTNNELDLSAVYAVAGEPPYSLPDGVRTTLKWLASAATH